MGRGSDRRGRRTVLRGLAGVALGAGISGTAAASGGRSRNPDSPGEAAGRGRPDQVPPESILGGEAVDVTMNENGGLESLVLKKTDRPPTDGPMPIAPDHPWKFTADEWSVDGDRVALESWPDGEYPYAYKPSGQTEGTWEFTMDSPDPESGNVNYTWFMMDDDWSHGYGVWVKYRYYYGTYLVSFFVTSGRTTYWFNHHPMDETKESYDITVEKDGYDFAVYESGNLLFTQTDNVFGVDDSSYVVLAPKASGERTWWDWYAP